MSQNTDKIKHTKEYGYTSLKMQAVEISGCDVVQNAQMAKLNKRTGKSNEYW